MRQTQSMERILAVKQMLEQKYSGVIHLLDCPEINVSSSEIRNRIAQHDSISGQLPMAVEQFIYEHSLYETSNF